MKTSLSQKRFLRKRRIESFSVIFLQVFILILFLGLWQVLSDKGVINSFIFSSPYKVMMSIKGLLVSGELYNHVYTTLKEIMLSFTIGSLLGFVLAVTFYLVPFLKKVMDPYLTLFNSLPKVSLGPILIIWLGANMKSIVVMSLLINVIVTLVTIYNGLVTTDAYKIKMFKSFGASTYQIMTKLVIASNKKTIFSSLKLNISMSLIGVIMGEFLVSKAGVGYLILYGTQVFNLTLVMAGIVIIMIISFILYEVLDILEKKC